MYAARLAKALQARLDVEIFGMGGPQMRAAGVEIITDSSEVAVVGITEIVGRLPSLLRAMDRLVSEADRRKPALAILTDFPEFHLRLARKLLPRGIRNVYFICPQFWAWRPWRVRLIRERFVKALCIFPFEEKFFRNSGVPTEFIGHPLVGAVSATQSREQFCAAQGLDPAGKIVTVLPGSRAGELAHHLPVLQEACAMIHGKAPAQFVVAAAHAQNVERLKAGWPAESERARGRGANVQRAGRRRCRDCLQRHRDRGSRVARCAYGGDLPGFGADGHFGGAPGAHTFLCHGESNCGAPGGTGIGAGPLYPGARGGRDPCACCKTLTRGKKCGAGWPKCGGNWGPQGPSSAPPTRLPLYWAPALATLPEALLSYVQAPDGNPPER